MLTLIPERERRQLTVSALKAMRLQHEPHWSDIAEFLLPYRHRLCLSDATRGDRRNFSIIDPTATLAVRSFKSGAMGYFISPSMPWFTLAADDPDLTEWGPAHEWLEFCRDEMLLRVFARSNLYNATHTFFGDWAGFGTAANFLDEDLEKVIHLRPEVAGGYWIANDHRGQVNTFYREFPMELHQIVEQFLLNAEGNAINWSKASIRMKEEWDQNRYHTRFNVGQLIQPNVHYDPARLSAAYKKFHSCYFELDEPNDKKEGVVLSKSGYDEFPVLASRFEAAENVPYGIDCPGMTAIGNVKQLQHNEMTGGKALDKTVDPPMMAPAELKTQRLSQLPGRITWFAGREKPPGLGPLHEVKFDIDRLEVKQSQVRDTIQDSFHVPLFRMLALLGDKDRTATEITARREEKFAELAPAGIRHNFDYSDPLIERTFNIMMRRRLLPPPPRELWGRPLKVEYTSLAAQAAKAAGLESIDRVLNVAVAIAQVYPEIRHKLKFENVLDQYAKRVGAPADMMRTDEEAAALAEQDRQAMAAQQAAAGIESVAKSAKDLSAADTEGKNALTDIQRAMEGRAA